MSNLLIKQLIKAKRDNKKSLAVLIDPDKVRLDKLDQVLQMAIEYKVDFLFVGGSLVVNDVLDKVLSIIVEKTDIPRIIFPGSLYQINQNAEGILLLSLISGRNPELLIGQHVIAAPYLRNSGLEILPTGYILVNGGSQTTVSYISNTSPIPPDKKDIACSTAMAGEMLGLKLIFLDAGSGAREAVSDEMIAEVRQNISVPLIVGGGIKTPEKIRSVLEAGADLVVIGDILEKDPELLQSFSQVFKEFNENSQ